MAGDNRDAWIERVLGFKIPDNGSGAGSDLPALDRALAAWSASRAAVIAALKQLEGGIRAMEDPLGDKAIIQVKAIAANLTAIPDTQDKVAELRRYIETDRIVVDAERPNGFGVDVKIRAPLLTALSALEAAIPA